MISKDIHLAHKSQKQSLSDNQGDGAANSYAADSLVDSVFNSSFNAISLIDTFEILVEANQYKDGDLVLVRDLQLDKAHGRKFDPKWIGPRVLVKANHV